MTGGQSGDYVYQADLIERALVAEEPVTKVDRTYDHHTLYHAIQEVGGVCWRCTLDTVDEREEYESSISVQFAKCWPKSDSKAFRQWSSMATGRLSGPQSLSSWERLFTAFNAVATLYHDDVEGRNPQPNILEGADD